jgi:ribonuclease HI
LTYRCWFDGACEPVNPGGKASYGIYIECDGQQIYEASCVVGSGPLMSCNVAEYAGIAGVFDFLLTNEASGTVVVYGDSDLVIRQLNGQWKAKAGLYLSYYRTAKEMLAKLKERCTVELYWIPREENEYCDRLSKR